MEKLIDYLKNSFTAFHAVKNAKALLEENNFEKLSETEDWQINEGGKYYITRGGALIAFTVGSLDNLSYKIAASHTDSPALKLKENPLQKSALYATLNTETYGGGIWYSFFDRPLKLAGRVIKQAENKLKEELVVSPFPLTLPSYHSLRCYSSKPFCKRRILRQRAGRFSPLAFFKQRGGKYANSPF